MMILMTCDTSRYNIRGGAHDSKYLIDVEFDFVEVFLWALSGTVVVVKTAVLSAQFLDVVIMRPSINLHKCNN